MTEVLATVRDTVVPESMQIDDTYQAVLAYRDGPYRWFPAQAERFHRAGKQLYPISVLGNNPHVAQVVDCENGDLTIARAVAWARERNNLHHDATIYASLGSIRSLVQALDGEPCWLWMAWWSGKPEVPLMDWLPKNVQIAAVQYENLPGWDLSAIVSREWPAHPYGDMAHW
jgi:hypothetical protein